MLADHPLRSTSRRPPRANGLYWIPFASFSLKNLISHRQSTRAAGQVDTGTSEESNIGYQAVPGIDRLSISPSARETVARSVQVCASPRFRASPAAVVIAPKYRTVRV